MHRPTDEHWQVVKCVLRYLARTLTHGIFLRSDSSLTLHAFFDADWAGDTDDYASKMHTLYTCALIQYHGLQRSNAEYHGLPQKPSIDLWLTSPLSYASCAHFLPNFVFTSSNRRLFIVIMWKPHIFALTRSSTPA